MLNFFLLYKYTITNFEKSSIVPVIFCCDGGDQFSGLDTRKIVRAKSFTRAIYSTQVVLLTKRTVKPKILTLFAFQKLEHTVFHIFCQHFIFAFRSKNKRAFKSKTSQPINNQDRRTVKP